MFGLALTHRLNRFRFLAYPRLRNLFARIQIHQRQPNHEFAAGAGAGAMGLHFSAVHLHQTFHQAQADAQTTLRPVERARLLSAPMEAQQVQLADADQILRIQFDDFTVGNTTLKEKEEEVSKDSVKVGEVTLEGKTIPVYNTVKAKLTTTRKELLSAGLLSMVVVDARTNGILTHQKFTGEYLWVNSWARFNGDERALTTQQLQLCRQKEVQPPDPQTLFLEFSKPIYNQLIPGLRSFYQNF